MGIDWVEICLKSMQFNIFKNIYDRFKDYAVGPFLNKYMSVICYFS